MACRHIIEPVIFCLAHVAGMLTRHAVGEKRFQDAKRYGYAGLMVGGMIPSAVLLLFAAAPEQFISLFINPDTVGDDRIIERAKLFLFISTLGLIPDAIRNIFSGTLRGYNDTAFASLSALFSVIGEGMLTSVSLGFGSSLDALGVLLGRTVAFTVGPV
ncbi:MATE family efflux transporter [Candidatus Glomeribacter gigasporarum]|nr:MATE family efflux transporter [Candidatus Glomeribacter gigasporarum]